MVLSHVKWYGWSAYVKGRFYSQFIEENPGDCDHVRSKV